MKNLTFLTKLFGHGSEMTTRQSGHTPDSIVSRFSLASLICACMLTLGVGNAWGDDVTIAVSSDTWTSTGTSGSGGATSVTKSGITVSSTKGYKDGTNHIREYSGSVITISSSVGNITSVVFTCTASGNSSNGPGKLSNGTGSGSYSYSNYNGTWTDATGTASVILNATAQCRWTQVVVTYTSGGGCSDEPTVGASLTSVSATVNSITATVPITAIGGCNITENGLVYSTSVAAPEVDAANCTKVTTTACGSTAEDKTVTITGLTCGQSYYVRGYATNSAGTSYTGVTTQATDACPTYTVTLETGTGSVSAGGWTGSGPYTQTAASVTLPSASPSSDCSTLGWVFAGWKEGSTQSEIHYRPTLRAAGSFTPNSNVTFYAVYRNGNDDVDDVLNQALTKVTGNSYTYFSGKTTTSGAVYEGQCAGSYNSIQLRNTSPSGIITTTSGGKAKKVTVVWEEHTVNGRTLSIYGKNTEYSNASDLYNDDTKGTLIGTIVCGTSTELIINDDYEYIGLSANGAMYLTSVTIQWSAGTSTWNSSPSCVAPVQCATPTFSPVAGTYTAAQTVTISSSTTGSTIYYTTNGDTPTTGSAHGTADAASATVTVSASQTIKAIAIKDGLSNSEVGSAEYVIQCATPTFSHGTSTSCGEISVTLSCTTDGATIRYTTDGSDPTELSTAYSSAITVSSTTTIKAKAFKSDLAASDAASATYTIQSSIANTQQTAYTVAQARAFIDNANVSACVAEEWVYVKGYVSAIVTAYNSGFGNITFNITDNSDGSGNIFQFFRNFKGANNTKWTSEDEVPHVGNYVIGYGRLTKYDGTYEFAAGNYCVLNTATVTYNGNGNTSGSAPTDANSPYASGATVTILGNTGSLAKTGYTFDGWNTANDGSETNYLADATLTIWANVTLYARWQQTVTLNTGLHGSGADKTPTVYLNGTSLSGFTAHTADNYELQGYFTASSGGIKVLNNDGSFAATNVTGYITDGKWTRADATTLYAQWADAIRTVTYNNNGGSGTIADATGASITLSDGTGFTAPSGYSFAGWNTANDGSGTHYAAGATVNINLNLYAEWQQTVTLNTGLHGSGADKTPSIYLNGASLSGFSAHTADGYTLLGYYTANSAGTKVLNNDGSFASTDVTDYITSSKWTKTGATTLYAQWEANTYTITSTLTNCSSSPAIPASYTYTGSAANLSYTISPTSGYWLPAAITLQMGGVDMTLGTDYTWNSSTGALNISAVITGNITLTIVAGQPYTVTLMDDDTELTQASYGASINLPERESCSGYTFAGWTKSWVAEQSEWTTTAPTIIPAGSYTPTDDENLYPVYTKTEAGEVSVTGGDMTAGVTSGWTISGTGVYSGNGVKFDDANDYVQSPDLSSHNYTKVTVKLKAGHNGGSGSILTIASLNGSGTVIDSKTFTPTEAYTSQSTINTFTLSGSQDIKYIRVTMTSKTKNLGMKYCEVFANNSTTSYISVPNCCVPAVTPLTITSSNTAVEGNTLSLTTSGGNGETVTWSVVNGTGSATIDGSTLTPGSLGTVTVTATQPDGTTYCGAEVTQTVTIYSATQFTVTLKDDDTELQQASGGAAIDLPWRTGCKGYTFVGWTKSWGAAQESWTTTAPTIIPAGSYIPTDDENLYPVYTKTEGEEEATVGTIILSENFSDFEEDANPAAPGASSITYDSEITYTCSPNGESGTRVMTDKNLILQKGGGYFTIANIPTGAAKTLTLRFSLTGSGTLNLTSTNVVVGSNTGTSEAREYTLTVNDNATSFGLTFTNSNNSNNLRLDDISITVATTGRVTSYISVSDCEIFDNDKTIFIQAESSSAWNDASCVKAWFTNSGVGSAVQPTYWLFDATGSDTGKKLFATIIPASGNINQVTMQRFASNCSDFWNNNGTLTGSSATSNTFRSYGASDNNIAWNATGVTLNLKSSLDSWTNTLDVFADQGGGVWTAAYNNYAPTGTSAEFKIETNYNGWIGHTNSNNNAVLSDMIVGSTYNVTATLDITDHSLVITKEFIKGTVHFDLQGHGSAIADITDVMAGHTITAPTAPSEDGYLFRGWFTDAGCTAGHEWDFAHDRVSETMTLYAKWVNDHFTVTWVANGTTLGTTPDIANGETTSAWSPAPTTSNCDGTKVFVGWTAIADYEHATNAPADLFTGTTPAITDDITFYAVFGLANGTKTYSFEITPNDFSTKSYDANNNEKTTIATDGNGAEMYVRWTSYDVYRTSAMQWRKKDGAKGGYIYNSTDLGTVNSVTVTSTEGTFTTYYGTSEKPESGAQGANKGYFLTKVGTDAKGLSSKVTVNFTAPYYLGYATTCVAETQCMTPMFDPGSGTYSSAQSVTIRSTAGSTIYYTTNGDTPTTGSAHGTVETGTATVTVSASQTLKAIAIGGCETPSEVATAVYHIRCAAPTFSPAPGTYTAPIVEDEEAHTHGVTISCETGGATIYITLDGSDPSNPENSSRIVYEGAIDVNETMVIKAVAEKSGMATSEVVIGKYIIADCNWYESFASTEGAGGNDDRWSGLSGTGGIVPDHAGWTVDNGGYGGFQCIKAGLSSKQGKITSPSISVEDDSPYKLTFDMAPWDNGTAHIKLTGAVIAGGSATEWNAPSAMTASEWNKYEVYIRTTGTALTIEFSSTGKRFWLNDLCVKALGDVKYHVTYEGNGNTGGTTPTDTNEPTGYESGSTVTVLANNAHNPEDTEHPESTDPLVKEGYIFAGWNTAANGSGTDYEADATFTITNDVTLYAKWTVDAYTIAWLVDGDPWTAGSPSTSATYGSQPTTIPTAPTSAECDGSKVFVGWSATALPDATNTRPKDLFTSKYSAPFITANTTFYAVFATPAEASTQFDLYSGALTEGEYLITYNDKAMKAAVTTNRLNYETVTVTDNKISTNEPTLVWYLYKGADNYWRIYNTTAGFAAATNTKNQAVIILDGSDDKAKWTDSVSTAYDFKNLARSLSASNPGNKWLRENGTYGFACYATGTGGSLTLYKRHAAYTGYITDCAEPVHPYLIAEPTMLDFGNVAVNASVPAQTITLSGDNLENTTLTVTAPAGFTVSPTTIAVSGTLAATTITVTPITTTAGTYNGNLTITYTDTDPAESITINIPLILKVTPLYTITLHDLNTDDGNPQVTTIKQTTPSSAVTLPTTSPSSVCMMYGWVFAGWVEGDPLSETSDKPTLFLADAAYTPASDIDLYAVYMDRTACTNSTDSLTNTLIGATEDTYADWDKKQATNAGHSNAEYAGITAGGYGAIQFRSTDESGLITTTSGGVVSKISITFNAGTVKGRVLQIYGKNTAYGTTSELYDPTTRGILLGTVTKGADIKTISLTIDADFEYIGIRSKDDLAYVDSISVVWSNSCTRKWNSNPACNPCTNKPSLNAATVKNGTIATTSVTVNCSGITAIGAGGVGTCEITSYGYCWGTSSTPNLTDYYHEVGKEYPTLNTAFGEYTITGLTPGVTYCVRPYATNGLGTAYGKDTCFTTTLVDHITFEVPNGVDAPQTVTLDVALPIADVPQDCGNCWVFVGWTPKETWDAAVLPDSLYKAGYSARSQGLNATYTMHAVYKRDFYRMLTYPSELMLDDGGAETAFDDNYYVLTLYTGEETGEWAMDAVLDNNNRNATTTNIDNILHLEFGNYSIFNPDPKDVWHLETLSKTGTGEGSSATIKIYNLVEGGQKKYIRLAGNGSQVITTNGSDGNLNLSVTSNNEAGLAASFNLYRKGSSGGWGGGSTYYYLARGTANGSYGFACSTSAPSYSAYVYKRKSLEYKTIPECPKYTVTWKLNGATVRTDYVSRCEGVPKPPTPPVVSPLDECAANGFLGWSTHKVGHLGAEYAPSDVFKDKEDAPELQGDITFYAIYGYAAGYEYVGDKSVLAHGETYLFVNRKNAGSGKAMNASGLTPVGNSSGYIVGGVNVTVGANGIIDGEFENLEFYCDQRKVNNSNLRVVSDASRSKYLFISDRGIGYKNNVARSHYTTKNYLYGWNDSQSSVRYAYWNGSNFTSNSYNKNVYAFRKIYKNFKTTCYEEWPAVAVEWGQNKLIIDMDTTVDAVNRAAKYDVQIGSLHTSRMDPVHTNTSYAGKSSARTFTIDGSSKFDFTTYGGDVVIVNWYDASNEKIAYSHIYIPSLVATNTTLTEDKDELHVLPGAMLTVNKPHDIGQLEIYPGATVFITGATLKAEKFILRGGWSRINSKDSAIYDVGRVDIHPSGSLNKSHAFMDWYLDNDLYYPIAVPFLVATNDIVFKNEAFTPAETRSVIKMKYYDGDQRAKTNQSMIGANWKDYSPLPTNLEPSMGYAFTVKRPSGRAFSIIRMPMSFTNAWTTNGEKGVVSGSQKNVVEITKYCYENTIWKAMGWNFVANPYMALYNGNYLTGKLEAQDGGDIRYATIPTIDFQDYYQVDITKADLRPGCGFFVQAGGSNGQTQNIIFASDGRKHMPARVMSGTMDDQEAYIRLTHADKNDQMGVIVGEDYTEEYEINADLVKFMSSDNSLKTYLRYPIPTGDSINIMDMAYLALSPELAKEWIPVIVRVPEAGWYTYSLKESSKVSALEAIWLIDAATGIKTNLLTDEYTFKVTTPGTISNRFSINAIVRPDGMPEGTGTITDDDDDKYVKFIFQNHIYIRHKGVIYDTTGKKVELNID